MKRIAPTLWSHRSSTVATRPHCSLRRPAAGMLLLFAICAVSSAGAMAAESVELRVLSSRPDMVSGGDVLIEVAGVGTVPPPQAEIVLNGHDVTHQFRASPYSRTLMGLVAGLTPGKNTLEVREGSALLAHLELTNHRLTGPIFSGPHQTPFICQTEAAGLGAPLDQDCSAKTVVSYFYKSTTQVTTQDFMAALKPGAHPLGFKPYDPAAPRPADMAETTAPNGRPMDYIVRRERGTINRAIYEIAFVHLPGTPLPDPWSTTPGWNGRLVYSFGGDCRAGYHQGLPLAGAVDDALLSQGYAAASSSLNVFGNNCDDVISAESMMMVKEYFIKRFGVPVHTIGWGGSGGSMQQILIAQDYPGLLDGIIPILSFPDQTTIIPGVVDCSLLAQFFDTSKLAWSEGQKTAVSGFSSWGTCAKEAKGNSWIRMQYSPDFVNPLACDKSIPQGLVYDPKSNPRGVRCDLYSNEATIYSRDPTTGLTRRPLDNVGVQYGLAAYNRGEISAEQFLELNEKIGGYDRDGRIVPERSVGDAEALRRAYATGRVNAGNEGLSTIPIIDFRPYLDALPDVHDQFRSFVMRARLSAANGNADNQVILTVPLGGDLIKVVLDRKSQFNTGWRHTLVLMDHWLDDIAKDHSAASAALKTARNKPPDLVDACWTADGKMIAEGRTYIGSGQCNKLYPSYGDPRTAAGEPLVDDILKCALKPVNSADYLRPLSPDQFARLKAIFPNGVCNYARPGVGQQRFDAPWRSY
jgi:hypothetical protein